MSVEEENAWQEPRARRNRRRGSGRAPHGCGPTPHGCAPADDDSDSLSDFSLVDAGEEASAFDDGLSYCDDRDSLEEWEFMDHGVVSRLVERSLSWVDAALRGFAGDFAVRGGGAAATARDTRAAKLRADREAERAIKRAQRRAELAKDRHGVLSSDEELEAAVAARRDFARRNRRSASALRCKGKALSKKAGRAAAC